nr:hypothetical protein [Nocardiopsis valliformis]
MGLDTSVVFGPSGLGLTSTVLHDRPGAIGWARSAAPRRDSPCGLSDPNSADPSSGTVVRPVGTKVARVRSLVECGVLTWVGERAVAGRGRCSHALVRVSRQKVRVAG